MKKRFILMAIVLLVVSVFALGCSNEASNGGETEGEVGEDQSLEAIMDKGTFVVGLDDTFAPMGFRDNNNNLVGFDVDLAKATVEKLGVEIELKPIEWSSKELSLNSGEIDCIWNGFSITPEREKEVLFSKPYLANEQIIITLADSDMESKADFAGRVVGAQINSSGLAALEADTEVVETLEEIREYDTYDQAFTDLMAGRIEAVVVDEVYGKYYAAQREGTFKVLD